MRKILALAAAAAALASGAAIAKTGADAVQSDVAYQALSEGRTGEALAQLRNSTAVRAGDPAALINLGTAYAREGRTADARAMFTAAIESPTRYQLELANGSWVDSHKAAKLALLSLDRRAELAIR